ncbi:LptF/LptG family permease [Alphaproteobacteria bacterium]|nr:LptF/LptG family permease [Alphaproteobacteria bacterium]
MQFNIYIFNQLFRATCVISMVLIGIMWLFQTIRLLELVVNKGAPIFDFLMMSITVIPLWLTIALPIAGFVAVNWVFYRILSDRELTVMQAIGLSPAQIAKAPMALGILLTSILYFNSVYLLPTSFGIYKDLQFNLRNGIPVILLQDGVFTEVVPGLTMFIGSRSENEIVYDVFIQDTRMTDRTVILTAQNGKFIGDDNRPTLILANGQRLEINSDGESGALLLFETHSLSLMTNEKKPSERIANDMNEDSISNLLDAEKSPYANYALQRIAEGHYRIASPLLALALIMTVITITLHGQLRRDLWLRRSFINISCCLGLIVALILARSWTITVPQLWILIHTVSILPILICGFALVSPLKYGRNM